MEDCSKCTRTDIKCCFTCKKDVEKCKVYHHCGSDCPKHEYRKITNADKIRSMSDEELADYIIFIGNGYNEKIPYCKSTPQCTEILDSGRIVPNEMCRECLVKWLQSETE